MLQKHIISLTMTSTNIEFSFFGMALLIILNASSFYDEAIFLQNNHQDGIDIYLFPDSNNECMGLANGGDQGDR
jgi:hypothetical protein